MNEEFKLSDVAIAQIARCIQLAFLSGTDLVDHLRIMRFAQGASGDLVPTDDYVKAFEGQLSSMQAEAEKWKAQLAQGGVDDTQE